KPAPARFWHRRAAQETAVHRFDAQFAAGDAKPIDADLALDGIDEHLGFVAFGLAVKPVEGLSGSLHLHASDVEGEWVQQLAPDRLAFGGLMPKPTPPSEDRPRSCCSGWSTAVHRSRRSCSCSAIAGSWMPGGTWRSSSGRTSVSRGASSMVGPR